MMKKYKKYFPFDLSGGRVVRNFRVKKKPSADRLLTGKILKS